MMNDELTTQTPGCCNAGFIIHHSSLIILAWLSLVLSASAMDRLTVRREGKTQEVAGRVLIDAQDGGLVLLARDGALWLVPPEELVKRDKDPTPYMPLTRDDLSKQVLAELPQGFKTYSTKHYLIFYDTSPAYAIWCGSLFEQLYKAFINYWSWRKFELSEPEFPLVAIVFADKQAYMKFSRPDLKDLSDSVIGYYGLVSNRMTMYDLTGAASQVRGRTRTAAQINEILAQPDARRAISTLVHEATHQIAFNCGLHTRLSDCPRWFSEGIAMFFENPDLSSPKGWSRIGGVNPPRLERFQKFMPTRPADSLETLLRDDRRFTDSKQMMDAYAEAWALTYFLIKKHSKEYISYLRMLSEKKPLLQDAPERRIDEFRRAFGELPKLDAEFVRYMTSGR
jgi:hypothetical protein